ncbi:unnamed protein product [Peniophora sp. CBMAI 1063]|nr:unnamed protein product [Peniophora sp. CBMAI 1063]
MLFFGFALFARAVLGVGAQGVPACATSCANEVATLVSCGSIANTTCICSTPQFPNLGGQCIAETCSSTDLPAAKTFFIDLCSMTATSSSASTNAASTSIDGSTLSPSSVQPTTSRSPSSIPTSSGTGRSSILIRSTPAISAPATSLTPSTSSPLATSSGPIFTPLPPLTTVLSVLSTPLDSTAADTEFVSELWGVCVAKLDVERIPYT